MIQKIIALCILTLSLSAQPQQTIRGRVQDKASSQSLPFATVQLLQTNPLLAVLADSAGLFEIPNVPVGRYDVQVSLTGYEPSVLREVSVISAKQTVLNVSLNEKATSLDEVVIKPNVNKEQALNNMALVGARMLSVDEAQRYAGGFDDPARLASAFAGVSANSGVNGIMVRGNAPKFAQWRMEGVEIPNPNHFGDLKAFGGGILTGLSSQMLANSDFFTGAFPAEYNNALSGIFDIQMRTGNNAKKERTFQLGLIGIDYAEEGAFRKGGKATYLFNYRDATLALLKPLLPENANSITYQDFSFKFNFPTNKAGTFTLWGIGLLDAAGAKPKEDSLKWYYDDDRQKNDIQQKSGACGLAHKYFLNSRSFLKTTLAATGVGTDWQSEVMNSSLQLQPYSHIVYSNWNYILSSVLNTKVNARHANRTGISVTQLNYNMMLNKSLSEGALPKEIVRSTGNSFLTSAYTNSMFQFGPRFTVNLGLNGQWFSLNNHYTIEPRASLRYALAKKQSIGLAYGLHSRLENLNYYYNNSLSTGETAVNKNLDFTKAHHVVVSYDLKLTDLLHLRLEPYYQQLFNVPVVENSPVSFINLQSDWFFAEKLQNTGEGRNYGVDLTLEKYISKGYYYLLTASLFEAKYKGGDGVWRDSRYNRNYVVNVLVGKEWKVGKNKQNAFSLNARVCYRGGDRYSPVDETATTAQQRVIYDDSRAFSLSSDPVTNVHFSISYKRNKLKSSREISLKILNLTGQADFYGYKYNYIKKRIDKDETIVVLPNISYKIQF